MQGMYNTFSVRQMDLTQVLYGPYLHAQLSEISQFGTIFFLVIDLQDVYRLFAF